MSGDGFKTKAVIDVSEEMLPKEYFAEKVNNILFIVEQKDIRTVITTRHLRYRIAEDNDLQGREYPPSNAIEESVQKHLSITETLVIPQDVKTKSLMMPRITFNVVDNGPNFNRLHSDEQAVQYIPKPKKHYNESKRKSRLKERVQFVKDEKEAGVEKASALKQKLNEFDSMKIEENLLSPKVSDSTKMFGSINRMCRVLHEETKPADYSKVQIIPPTNTTSKHLRKKKAPKTALLTECVPQDRVNLTQTEAEVISLKSNVSKKKSKFSKVGDSLKEEKAEKHLLSRQKRNKSASFSKYHRATQTKIHEMDHQEIANYLAKKNSPSLDIEEIDQICESVLKTVIAVHQEIKKHKLH